MAKSGAVQRESEGTVVPQTSVRAGRTNAVTNNAAGGKGPCGDRAGAAGKRERMTGKTGAGDSKADRAFPHRDDPLPRELA